MTLDIRDTTLQHRQEQYIRNTYEDVPFALPIHFVFRKRDILVLNFDPTLLRNLPQILISCPLKG